MKIKVINEQENIQEVMQVLFTHLEPNTVQLASNDIHCRGTASTIFSSNDNFIRAVPLRQFYLTELY
ncbi:MAG: hypothetical protein ACFKPT_03725 [Gloeotrichia echinulata GP01]